MGRDVLSPLGVVSGDVAVGPPERKFWNFQVKMQDFVHFYCEKLLVTSNQDRGA